ncbi:MAG TPA: hypothetical protein VGF99_04065 [Myxococcota bacterium]
MRAAVFVVAVAAGAGCPATTPPAPPPPPPYAFPTKPLCPIAYGQTPTVLGHLDDGRLTEVSGLVSSPTTADLVWVHNDSGDTAAIYALHADGRLRAAVALPVAVRDVEDIAAATCPDGRGPCLFIADTGNNAGTRTDASIIIVIEPVPDATGALPATATVVATVPLSSTGLPAGIDIEALAVVPDGETMLVIEKVDAERARVFALAAPYASTSATVVGTVRTESPAAVQYARMVTSAAVHPSGTALVVRTYTGVFEARFSDVESLLDLGDVALGTVTFGPFSEPQGEAVGYSADGFGILTISEADGRAASEVAVNLLPCP